MQGLREDCLGVAGGAALVDRCGVCQHPTNSSFVAAAPPCRADCGGVWGGGSSLDACGVCGGSGACFDCAQWPHGANLTDRCGTCDDDNANDCVADCGGAWGGGSSLDACGVCGGSGRACLDCAQWRFGTNETDACGTCDDDNANNCVADCGGAWGGGSSLDACGVCGGDNRTCASETAASALTLVGGPGDYTAANGNSSAQASALARLLAAVAEALGLASVQLLSHVTITPVTVTPPPPPGSGRRRALAGSGYVKISFQAQLPKGSNVSEAFARAGRNLSAQAAALNLSLPPGAREAGAGVYAGGLLSPPRKLHYDCFGVRDGNRTLDRCGVCGGDGIACLDCRGVPNGASRADQCGTCDADAGNNCRTDCRGVWGGGARLDACAVCGGQASGGCSAAPSRSAPPTLAPSRASSATPSSPQAPPTRAPTLQWAPEPAQTEFVDTFEDPGAQSSAGSLTFTVALAAALAALASGAVFYCLGLARRLSRRQIYAVSDSAPEWARLANAKRGSAKVAPAREQQRRAPGPREGRGRGA